MVSYVLSLLPDHVPFLNCYMVGVVAVYPQIRNVILSVFV